MGVSWAVIDHHIGERIGANEIVHYGVHHHQFPCVKNFLGLCRRRNKHSRSVWFLRRMLAARHPCVSSVTPLTGGAKRGTCVG